MTDQQYQDLPRAKRRSLIVWAALRSLLVAVVLVVLYYVLPLDRPVDSDTAIRLLVGLLVFAGVMVWAVRTIAGSRYPGMRAAEALGLIIPFFLLLFASTYFEMARASAASFNESLTRTDALYFTVTVFTKLPWPGKHEAARTTAQCAIEVHQRDIRTRPLRFRCTGWTPSAAEDGYAEPVARDPGGVTAFHQCRFTRPEVNGWARIRDVALPRPGTTTPTVGDRGHFGTRVSRSHH
jgi:hypothetical protein